MHIPTILKNPKQRIADVKCTRIAFQPGDRVLVKTWHRLDVEAQKKFIKAVKKWAGVEVEVLIICLKDMDLEIDRVKNIV